MFSRRAPRTLAVFLLLWLAACAAPVNLVLSPRAPVSQAVARGPAPEFGVNIYNLENEAAFARARRAGFTFVRTDLFWEGIEKHGQYDFRFYDAALDRLERQGLGALLILDYGHPDHGGHHIRTGQQRAAFLNYVRAAVAHYAGRRVRWEIWNEPDVDEAERFLEPPAFAELVRETAEAIRQIDPNAVIISGGLSWVDQTYVNGLLEAWRERAAPEINAFGIHPYRQGGPESAGQDIANLRALLHQHHRAWPVWTTEWGYSSTWMQQFDGHSDVGRLRQAVLASRWALTSWAIGSPIAVWYELSDRDDDANDPGDNYGLLEEHGADKPALRAFEAFRAQLAGASLVGLVRTMPHGVFALRFHAPDRDVIAVWVDRDGLSADIDLEARNFAGAVNLWGQPIGMIGPAPHISVSVGDGPVFLTWRR